MTSLKHYQNYINGEWENSLSGKTYEVFNPADKNQLLGIIPFSLREDLDNAIDSASSSLEKWSKITAPQRGEILFEALKIMDSRKEELAQTITLEEGKILSDSQAEVKRAMNIIEFSAGEGRRLLGNTNQSEHQDNVSYTIRKPLGVVGIITPWNFPLAIPAWKIAPALICGNTLVLKPAFSTPLSAIKLMEIFEEAGLPSGVINLVTGSGSEIGQGLIEDKRIQGISFTGSTEIGTKIYSDGASKLKKIQCEIGGKNAVIVLNDADIEKAVKDVAIGAFGSTGQRCTATSRVIIEKDIYDEFIEKLIIFTKELKVGNGSDREIDVGPLSSLDQLEKVTEYIGLGVEQGAKILFGGHKLEGGIFDDGFYVEPTIFVDLKAQGLHPDGSVCDSEGFLWNAQYGASRLARYSPEGWLDRVEKLPASQVTCPAFGGKSFDTIFVTTASQTLSDEDLKAEPLAGKVFHFESDTVGLAEYQVKL